MTSFDHNSQIELTSGYQRACPDCVEIQAFVKFDVITTVHLGFRGEFDDCAARFRLTEFRRGNIAPLPNRGKCSSSGVIAEWLGERIISNLNDGFERLNVPTEIL